MHGDEQPKRRHTRVQAVLSELRKDFDHHEETAIWDVVGEEEEVAHKILRFGSRIDRLMFRIMRVIAFIDVVWVPFLLSFGKISWIDTDVVEGPMLTVDAMLNTMYALGVLLKIRTSFVELVTGREYVEPTEIILHRGMSPTFWIDTVSLVGALWYSVGPRALAAFCMLRSWRLSAAADDLYELHAATMSGENPAFSLIGLMFSIVVVIHVFACAWFGAFTLSAPDWDRELMKDPRFLGGGFRHVYLVYFADGASMLVGWGGPQPSSSEGYYMPMELITWSILAPMAAISNAFVFAQLLEVVNQAASTTSKHLSKMEALASVCAALQVPKDLRQRCLKYQTFLSVHSASQDDYDSLFKAMSVDLQQEVTLHLFERLVEKASFFYDIPSLVIKDIVLAFEQEVFGPGQNIFQKGDMGNELFFIIKGVATVVVDGGIVVGMKKAGEHFGEVALVYDQPRSATVKAKTFCIVAKLARSSFTGILDKVPHIKEIVIQKIASYSVVVGAEPACESREPASLAHSEIIPLLSGERDSRKAPPRLSMAAGAKTAKPALVQQLVEEMSEIQRRMKKVEGIVEQLTT